MARKYRRYGNDNSFEKIVSPLVGLFFLYLLALWFGNRSLFYLWLFNGIVVFAFVIGGIILWHTVMKQMRLKRLNSILTTLKQLGLEENVVNFINRFGLEKKMKVAWTYRGYSFDWQRLVEFRKILNEKGLNLSLNKWDDMIFLLHHYIDQKEERLTRDSIDLSQRMFNELSGSEFEDLLYRLFEAMGYTVQKTGRTGDQGGDLVANISGEQRILIQAKRYNGSVGNAAVQEASAAQKYYDCNGAWVVASSTFTREATELAKVTNVLLVGKERLSELLLQYLKESWS